MGVRRLFALTALALCAACSAPPSAQERARDAELAAVAPLRTKYQGVVMGFDVSHGTTLVVSLDMQDLVDQMDDGTQNAMRRDVLSRWSGAWKAQHPGEHAALEVRFVDFRGNPVFTDRAKV